MVNKFFILIIFGLRTLHEFGRFSSCSLLFLVSCFCQCHSDSHTSEFLSPYQTRLEFLTKPDWVRELSLFTGGGSVLQGGGQRVEHTEIEGGHIFSANLLRGGGQNLSSQILVGSYKDTRN